MMGVLTYLVNTVVIMTTLYETFVCTLYRMTP